MLKYFFPLLSFLVSFLPVNAKEEDFREVIVKTLCFQGSTTELICKDPEDAPLSCQLVREQITRPIRLYAKQNKLLFYRDDTLCASVTIPTQLNSVILLFVENPKPDADEQWKVAVIDDSAKNIPYGGFHFINLYQKEIRGLIGEHKILLKPGQRKSFTRPEERNEFNMAGVAFQFKMDDVWRTAKKTGIRFTEKKRYLFLSYLDARVNRPRVTSYRIYDYPLPQ